MASVIKGNSSIGGESEVRLQDEPEEAGKVILGRGTACTKAGTGHGPW